MNVDVQSLSFIQNVVKTAKVLKIQNIIIEPGKVRGMDDDQTVVIYQDQNVPNMPFGSIGLNRLDVFSSRFDIIRATAGFNIEVSTIGDDDSIGFDKFDIKDKNKQGVKPPMWAKALAMSGLNTTIDYRCANPSIIKAPKSRADINRYLLNMTENAFTMILKGKSAMDSDFVTIKGNARSVQLLVTDDNGDSLKYKFGDDIICLIPGEDFPSFSFNYPIEKLIPLFKPNPDVGFHITEKGFLVGTLNDLDIYIAPTTQI
jgi:hypothetical protein